jgi:hypothetical protein
MRNFQDQSGPVGGGPGVDPRWQGSYGCLEAITEFRVHRHLNIRAALIEAAEQS